MWQGVQNFGDWCHRRACVCVCVCTTVIQTYICVCACVYNYTYVWCVSLQWLMPYLTQRDSQLGSKPGLTDVSFDCSDSQSVWSRWWLLLIFGSIWLMSYLTSASSHFLINSPPQLETLVTLLHAVPIIISLNHLNHCISSKRYLPLMWDFWPQLNIVIAYLDLQHKECRCLLTLIVNETEVLLQFLVNISTKNI